MMTEVMKLFCYGLWSQFMLLDTALSDPPIRCIYNQILVCCPCFLLCCIHTVHGFALCILLKDYTLYLMSVVTCHIGSSLGDNLLMFNDIIIMKGIKTIFYMVHSFVYNMLMCHFIAQTIGILIMLLLLDFPVAQIFTI